MMMNHEFGESSSSESSVNVYGLTQDLVIEILLRLPVIDLIRMKRVCKSLYCLINSSDFIARHSLFDGDRDPYMFMSIPYEGTRVVTYDDDDDTTELRKRGAIHIRPTHPQPQAHRLYCYCCCDGVLFVNYLNNSPVYGLPYNLALWNPATGDVKDIPIYEHLVYSDDSDDGAENSLSLDGYGCGFDFKNNEYRPFFVLSDKYLYRMEIEIYSYKKKIWKIIKSSGIISHWASFTCHGMVYANGFCHWPGFNRLVGHNGRDVIVSFDATDAVILTTPFPDDIVLTYNFPHYDSHRCPYPLLLNDSLALVVNKHGNSFTYDGTTSCFDIWVLGQYGDKDSWTKLFTIGTLHGIQHVMGFWNETKIFLAEHDSLHGRDAKLFLYDTVTEQALDCLQNITTSTKMCTCRLSLLPLAADGSKKTTIKKRVRRRFRVLAIKIRNRNTKMKPKTSLTDYFIVVNYKKVLLTDY